MSQGVCWHFQNYAKIMATFVRSRTEMQLENQEEEIVQVNFRRESKP